jgi:hypothetical protein
LLRVSGPTLVSAQYAPKTLNGQVWEEAELNSHLLRAGDAITIKRGVLGAFYMSSDQVFGLRVTRLR